MSYAITKSPARFWSEDDAFKQTVFSGTAIAETRNENLISDTEADAEREVAAFGNEYRPTGFTGSVAMCGISTFGNTENVGAGHRTMLTPDTQWSVRSGHGYRFADLGALATAGVREFGFGISSDFSKDLPNSLSLTNDTDVIWSKSDTVVHDDLAISVAMSDALALRTSLLDEYHSQLTEGAKNMDNTVSLSLVCTFK